MARLTEEDLADILSGVVQEEPAALAAAPSAQTFTSDWLFDEIDTVYHRPVGRSLHQQPHGELCGIIESVLGDCSFTSGGQKLIMIGVPRGSNKTTIAAENVPPVILTRNPNARIMLDSFRFDVSKKRLRAVQWHFEKNAAFREKYGDDWVPQFRELPWSDSAMVVTKRTKPFIEPSIEASGTDRSATGAHFDVIIADDLVNDVNCRTREQRDKVYDHILDQQSVLEPNGVFILIFTTWHTDDAYARFMRLDDERVRKGQKPHWQRVIRGCYDGPNGLYYPDRLTHEFLDLIREKIGSRKFSSQFLLKPISDEDKTFSMDIARIVTFSFEPRQFGGIVTIPRWANERLPVSTTLYWDPAGPRAGGRRHDEHGLTVVGDDPLDRWWVLEAEGLKTTSTLILDRVIKLVVYYHVASIGIEDEGMQELWKELLEAEFDRRGIPRPLITLVSGRGVPKNERIAAKIQPRWERGGIILQPDQSALYAQIDGFSLSNTDDHEDILDSLAGHDSIARPAAPDFMHVRDENPVDQAWLDRRDRLRREMLGSGPGARSDEGGAGLHGVGWAV